MSKPNSLFVPYGIHLSKLVSCIKIGVIPGPCFAQINSGANAAALRADMNKNSFGLATDNWPGTACGRRGHASHPRSNGAQLSRL
eukprot:365102-Chlamydomonas_euryale.AAC.7